MMTPERWQQIERLYQAVLDMDPSERSAFLENACTGDPSLCQEVMSLLEAQDGHSFFERPLRVPEGSASRLSVGCRLGSYELVRPLGAGAMGEVWQALDTDLNRPVAIKILPSQFAIDPDRLRRFEQEARVIAQLSHPNVLSIFAIGRHEDAPYLVTELLEGATLRDTVAGGAMAEDRALDYAEQIAEGLAAAHDKGIGHRDLNPEN